MAINTASIRVLIADDHAIVREGIASLLGTHSNLIIVALASNAAETEALFHTERPDVTLISHRMRGANNSDAFSALLEKYPDAAVVLFSVSEFREDIRRSVQAGVRAYHPKEAPGTELVETIFAVARGGSHIPPSISAILAECVLEPKLTTRERQVLIRIADGKSNAEIAALLGITQGTVKAHINALLSKLQVKDRTQAALAALKSGLVRLH